MRLLGFLTVRELPNGFERADCPLNDILEGHKAISERDDPVLLRQLGPFQGWEGEQVS